MKVCVSKDQDLLQGSMTVFMGMTILAILSIFFSLLEVVHYYAIKKETIIVTDIGIESLMADYCRPLWDDYGLLGIDGGYGAKEFLPEMAEMRTLGYLSDNLSVAEDAEGACHLGMNPTECRLSSYGLLADNDGSAFVKECAKGAMYGLPEDALKGLDDDGEKTLDASRDENDIDKMLDDGDSAVKEAPNSISADEGEYKKPEGGLSDADAASVGNPIDTICEWKSKGILAQVIPRQSGYSNAAFAQDELLSERSREHGNLSATPGISVAEWSLYHYYLKSKFACYTKDRGRKGIKYELEYIISGKKDDKSNLSAAAEKLVAIRSAVNLACIMQDEKRLLEAESVAWAIAGYTANPVIIKAVKVGIVAAWVYVESVLDVRRLLSGGRVPLIKTPPQWTSDILLLPSYLDASVGADDCPDGIDYNSYLIAILITVSDQKKALRAMDLIENEIRLMEDYHDIRLDNFIFQAEIKCTYEASPVFGSLVSAGRPPSGYVFNAKRMESYVEKNKN